MESFLDTSIVQREFRREIQTLPISLRNPLEEWHQRLKQNARDVCILSTDAEKAYERYRDAILEISRNFSLKTEGNPITELYGHIPSDALLVAALFASMGNTTLKPTIIELKEWARAQQFIEEQRKRYHDLSLIEAQKILDLSSDITNKYQGRVSVKNHTTVDFPFFLWTPIAVHTDDPEWHGIRLLAQRAYYPQDLNDMP
jgi:hypothetical protein